MRIRYEVWDEKTERFYRCMSPTTFLKNHARADLRKWVLDFKRRNRMKGRLQPYEKRKYRARAIDRDVTLDTNPPIPGLRSPEQLASMQKEAFHFESEAEARDWFAKHLEIFEPGLRPYCDDLQSAVEFKCGKMRIDILAEDRHGGFVVIELKLFNDVGDRVVGQTLRYMGWVRRNLAKDGQRVRGMVLTNAINEKLLLACSEVSDLMLFRYLHSLGVERHC